VEGTGFRPSVSQDPQTVFGWRGEEALTIRCISGHGIAVVFAWVTDQAIDSGALVEAVTRAYRNRGMAGGGNLGGGGAGGNLGGGFGGNLAAGPAANRAVAAGETPEGPAGCAMASEARRRVRGRGGEPGFPAGWRAMAGRFRGPWHPPRSDCRSGRKTGRRPGGTFQRYRAIPGYGFPQDSRMTVSRQEFRDAMARLGAAVNIVTTDGPAGLSGMTVSAVCSVTDDPPMLLVCLNRGSPQNRLFKDNGVLCVNSLASGQEELSVRFAGRSASRHARTLQPCDLGAARHRRAGAGWLRRLLRLPHRRRDERGTHSVLFARWRRCVRARRREG